MYTVESNWTVFSLYKGLKKFFPHINIYRVICWLISSSAQKERSSFILACIWILCGYCFLQKRIDSLQEAFIHPPEAHYLYGWMHFIWLLLDCWTKTPTHAIIKLGGAGTIFNIAERRKSYPPRMLRGWVKHGLNFIFGWTNPLMLAIWIKHAYS